MLTERSCAMVWSARAWSTDPASGLTYFEFEEIGRLSSSKGVVGASSSDGRDYVRDYRWIDDLPSKCQKQFIRSELDPSRPGPSTIPDEIYRVLTAFLLMYGQPAAVVLNHFIHYKLRLRSM